MTDTHHQRTSLGLKIPEIMIIGVLAVVYIIIRINEMNAIYVAALGFLLALWAIMRPSEWAVEGLSMLAQRVGIGNYAAGVIGSIMANLPELVLASILIMKGESRLAILTVLIVAGANTLLFGIVTIKNTVKNDGFVRVPVTTLRYESELMMVAFITSLFLFVFNFAEDLRGEISGSGTHEATVTIPVLFSVGTVIIYVAYLIFIARDKELNPTRTVEEKNDILKQPALQRGNIIKFLVLGTVGIVIAGELLANGAELLIKEAETSDIELTEAHIALIVGFLGSLPEWAIAFRAGDDIELVFGSVLSSISATLLFMIGLVSIFLFAINDDFALDTFAIVQIMLSGSILLFVNMLIKDDLKLDTFEGICIVVLQLIGFDVLISVT